jgi:hypothetical protein
MSEIRAIEIRATVWKVASRQDHTFDVTFKVSEDCLEQTQQLIAHMLDEVRMVIEFEPQVRENNGNDRSRSKVGKIRKGQ